MKCPHSSFTAVVRVARLEDSGRFNAEVTVQCADCGTPFRFKGLPLGLNLDGAAMSIDGTEARLAIEPADGSGEVTKMGRPMGFAVREIRPPGSGA